MRRLISIKYVAALCEVVAVPFLGISFGGTPFGIFFVDEVWSIGLVPVAICLVAVAVPPTVAVLVATGSAFAVSVTVLDCGGWGRGMTVGSRTVPGVVVVDSPVTPTEKATTQNAIATSFCSARIGIILSVYNSVMGKFLGNVTLY